MAPAICHAQNLRFLKFHYLVIEAITLPSFWYMKPNHGWSYSRIINVYVLKISHNPGQNLLKQKLKIQEIQEMAQFLKIPNSTPYPLISMLNLAQFCCQKLKILPSFVVKNLKLCEEHWFGGRGVFSLKNKFSILSQQFCPRL